MSLDPSRFHSLEYTNTEWTLTVESGTSLNDVLNPAFLANVAVHLHQYDHIRVRVDSGEWYAELMVTSCDRVWAKLIVLKQLTLIDENAGALEGEAAEKYIISHRGAHLKHSVIRKSDKEVIRDGFSTRQEANVWLTSHLLTL